MTPASDERFLCEFCRRSFSTELRLVHHLCEAKRRHMQRNDKAVHLGFIAYQHFYLRSMGRRKPPTYASFAKSDLYSAFVRFGRHLVALHAINALGFIDWLLQAGAKLDNWTNLALYGMYVREFTKSECALDAIERNFMLMQQWASDAHQDWRNFFREIEPPLAVLWITSGRITPWLLFTASSADDLMQRLTGEQMRTVEAAIDAEFWRIKLDWHKTEVEMIRAMLSEHGI